MVSLSRMTSNLAPGPLSFNSPSQGSNPPVPASQSGDWRLCPQQAEKSPTMAGFCESAISLRAPKRAAVGAKSLIVSGRYLKYSRFRETPAGDRVRSALRGRVCSVTGQILRLDRRQIGNVGPALPHGACSGISPILRHDRRQIGNAEPALRRGCRAVPRGMLTAEAVSAHEVQGGPRRVRQIKIAR
jgi:hypothetical protein